MRVTTRMLTQHTAANIMANADAMQQTQRQLTTGKRILRPGDDPAGAAFGVRLRSQNLRDDQYLRNIEQSRTWLDTTDSVLGDIGDLLGRARELSVQASTGTLGAGDTAQVAEEINAIRNQIISSLNRTVDVDQHMFSGQMTDTAPVSVDPTTGIATFVGDTGVSLPNPTDLTSANGIDQVLATSPLTAKGGYSIDVSISNGQATVTATRTADGKAETQTFAIPGTGAAPVPVEFANLGLNLVVNENLTTINGNNTFEVDGVGLAHDIAPGSTLDVNVSAGSLMPILAQLKTLHTALVNGTGANSAANTAIGAIDVAADRVLSMRAQVGAKTNHIEFAQARREAMQIEGNRLLSVNEDIDLTEALTRLTAQQTIYKASLEVGSRVMQNSLLDFLR
jgi:flagellar hook-associated protein 3 FlgL